MLSIRDWGGRVGGGHTRWELIIGLLDSQSVKGIVRWATASIGRWFLIGGTGRGDFQCRGRYTDDRPLVMAREQSGARCAESEGNEGWSRAVAGFTLGGEQTTLSPANLCRCLIRRETGGRQDSTDSIPVGVAEKQFVVQLWTLRQNVSRRFVVATLGVNRSAPYRRMRAISDVASLWHR